MAVSEKVLGVTCEGKFRAYQLSEMPGGVSVINDTFGEVPVVIIVDQANNYAAAFEAMVGDQSLMFSTDGQKIMDATETVAGEFPDKDFVHVSGYKFNGTNFGNLMGAMEDIKYLAGILAGSRAN